MGGGRPVSLTSPLGWAWIGLITIRSMCVTPSFTIDPWQSAAPAHRSPKDPARPRSRGSTDALVAECGQASSSDLGPPEPAPDRGGRTRPAQGLAGGRRHLHGVLAGPALWRSPPRRLGTGSRRPRRCRSLPKISDALAQGKLSFDQVKPLTEVAKPESDAKLAEDATHWSAKQVRDLAKAHKNQSDDEAAGAYRRRSLRFNDARRSLSRVPPRRSVRHRQGSPDQHGQRRTWATKTPFDQRMADALYGLCSAGGPTRDRTDSRSRRRGHGGRSHRERNQQGGRGKRRPPTHQRRDGHRARPQRHRGRRH